MGDSKLFSEIRSEVRRQLSGVPLGAIRENEIVEELSQHLLDRTEEMRQNGASEDEVIRSIRADLRASDWLRELRRVETVPQEQFVLGARRNNMIRDMVQDTRYGLRSLRKNPGFGALVILTLAVGIGASTAIFSVVNAVMLRALPFQNPDRLVRIYESNPERGWPIFSASHPNFLDWRSYTQSFESIAASASTSFNYGPAGDVEVIRGSAVTADLLPTLGQKLALGRNFLPEEDRPGGNNRVVIVSYGFWQRHLGADPNVIGQTVNLSDQPFTVVGVLTEEFAWGAPDLQLLVPLAPDPNRSRGDHRLLVIGRLKNGVSLEAALNDLNGIAARLSEQYPESNKGWSVGGSSFYDWIVPEANRRSILVFVAAVAAVLLIACANIANLLLARGAVRQREIALRVALGASRSRIVRQLLTESVLMAVVGGGLGIGLCLLIVRTLKSMSPTNLPRLDELSVDMRVLVFGLVLSIVTGVLFGLFPAAQASRTNLNDALKEGGRSDGSGGPKQRIRTLLVIAEVGMSVMLLTAAGLLLRSFWRLQQVQPGFEPDRALTMRINLPRSRYAENAQGWNFYRELVASVQNVPGVTAAGVTSLLPMDGGNTASEVTIPGQPAPDGTKPSADWRIVSIGFFRAMGVRVRGREFDEHDTDKSQRVTIISEEMARRFWPNEDPIGRQVVLHSFGKEPMTIIGVAGDIRNAGLDSDLRPAAYAPTAVAALWNPMFLVVRTSTDPASRVGAVREVFKSLDGNVPVASVRTLDELVSNSLGQRRFTMFLLIAFAAAALLLACVGLFGVMAYLVSQRTHEIGVRLALGAKPRDVFALIIGRGMAFAATGSVLGIVGAIWLLRFIQDLLFQVGVRDPMTFVSAPVLLLLVAFVACYVPAHRAMKVDPLIALRYE